MIGWLERVAVGWMVGFALGTGLHVTHNHKNAVRKRRA